MTLPRIAIVGLGRESMSDDAVGLRVVELLSARPWASMDVSCISTEDPVSILVHPDLLNRDLVIFVDASPDDCDHRCGSCVRVDLSDPCARILHRGSLGTHGVGLDTVLRLGEELGCLPPAIWVYLIFAHGLVRGFQLTPALDSQVAGLVEKIAADVEALTAEAACTSSP